ncbi:MAG: DUF4124 domain-containing protein [Pseudomonadales bacterium]
MPRSTQNIAKATAVTMERDFTRPLLMSALGLCLITAALLSRTADAGEVFRWTTSDGTVHYGEHPPQGVSATQMSTTTGKPSKRSSSRDRVEPGEDIGKEAEAKAEQENQPAATAPTEAKPIKDKGICERARYNLKVLDERARIRQKNEDGEESYLSEEQKDKQKEKAREAIKTYC